MNCQRVTIRSENVAELSAALVDMLPPGPKSAIMEADIDTQQSTSISDFGLTSTQLIEFIMKIESEFDIAIGDIDIVEFGNKSISQIAELIANDR